MRIYLSSPHKFPGLRFGVASSVVHDRLARGLAELGHDVRYHINNPETADLPSGIRAVTGVEGDEDILHINHLSLTQVPNTTLPWVRSIHSDLPDQGYLRAQSKPNFIFVSRTIARLHGSDRFIHNGIDPAEFIYSETKNPYLLFIVSGGIHKARVHKGLDTAFWVAKETGYRLVVAGGDPHEMAEFGDLCRANSAKFIGPVYGVRKAEIFTAATALIFPTRINEAFGLPVAEALMSGTPVIASTNGAMPEIVHPTVGFVCSDKWDYLAAVDNIKNISPADCRSFALERFHYLDMARGYVREYQTEAAVEQGRFAAAGGITSLL
jgi:glycosyltransferase involved in cell wall biosynthesis